MDEQTKKVLGELAEPFEKLSAAKKVRSHRYYGKDFDGFPGKSIATRRKHKQSGLTEQRSILKAAGLASTSEGKKIEAFCDSKGSLTVHHQKDAQLYMDTIAKASGVTPERIVEEIALIAFSKDGEPFASEDFNNNLKVSMRDKLKALDMLAKWAGLYEKDNAQKAAQSQMLQITFVGNDVAATVDARQKRNEELRKETVWDVETSTKTISALKQAKAKKNGV